jgi:hypothetical protein
LVIVIILLLLGKGEKKVAPESLVSRCSVSRSDASARAHTLVCVLCARTRKKA